MEGVRLRVWGFRILDGRGHTRTFFKEGGEGVNYDEERTISCNCMKEDSWQGQGP